MKDILKVMLVGLTPFLIMLALTAFVTWKADVSTWSDDARFFCAMVGFICGIPAALFAWELRK